MLIIGASDAGISAALRIRELAPEAEITVVAKDAYPNFSICGLPFYLSGEVADWRDLAYRSAAEIARHGIHLLLNHEALAVDPKAKQVSARTAGGNIRRIEYDKLLIASGADSIKPPIKGLDSSGVFFCVGWQTALHPHHGWPLLRTAARGQDGRAPHFLNRISEQVHPNFKK